MLENAEGTLGNCAFSNVRMPLVLAEVQGVAAAQGGEREEVPGAVREYLTGTMVREFNTFMAVIFYDGAWWIRLSAQIYLDMADFERAAAVLQELAGRVMKGAFLEKAEAKL